MANVLVTGGAGFIGSHVVEACLEAGDSVWVVDNLASGLVEDISTGAVFCEGDIADAGFMRRVVEEASPAVIHHLAAQSSVAHSLADPLLDARVNVLGTLSVLEAARSMGSMPRVIYAATGGACYGDPEEEIVDENCPFAPASHYGMSKVAGERHLTFYGAHFGLPVVSLRLANVYGPRQRPSLDAGVISIFAEKLTNAEPLTLYGHGRAGRDYVYVKDVVKAFTTAAKGGADGGAYNIGTGVVTEVEALLEVLCRRMGETPVSVERAPLRAGEVFRIGLDASAFAQKTGWRHSFSLDEGIAAFLESLEY
ncbi:MAG: GDP-mannose 4,6-dehydratase [Nitrospinae bacterium]|nr:GDP-mannose 4,6-dehydratase [Nitrospinota bacterium]